MKKQKNAPRLGNLTGGVSSVLASLVCILVGLVVGFLVLLVLGGVTLAQEGTSFSLGELLKTTWEQGFKPILQGGFYAKANTMGMGVRMEILQAAPLVFTGLSVAFAFKTGLFNIGAAGQYTVGAFFALFAALVLKWPWYLCLLAAGVGGAIWGAIPGLFKAFLNVNEVITSIMFNWVGLYAVNTLIYQQGAGPMFNANTTKTYTLKEVSPQSLLPSFNVKVGGEDYFGKLFQPTIGIFIAIAVAVIIWIIINKTTFGYELKACGHNKEAARYAGINEKKNIVLSMTIAGALAGLGAGVFYLSGSKEWEPLVSTMLPATGFNGISVALLATSNPIGCIFSAIFISHITVGGGFMYAKLFPSEVADIISGVVIYLCAFSLLFKTGILRLFKSRNKPVKAIVPDKGKEADA
ncbi:MAG TPA: ABC transporter permease [Candidatus Faecousia excrementigallinarum]|uniref:ABC transporter permease n=1 Tax=Candidatus Faecousia excrementigallinarum TaxID=2840806 RepID=A0A9D1CMP3_9FIRM|nr:ABC transporter permease [Candidatus Faecousia excrementigallinarum]